MNATNALTELEQRLAAPDGGALRDALAHRLAALESAARARLQTGLVPVAFQQCQAVAQAASAARDVLAELPLITDADAPSPSAALPPLNR